MTVGPTAENMNTPSIPFARRSVSIAWTGLWAIGPATLNDVFTATSTPIRRPSGACVLSAREPFFLIVADDPQTACGCHLDERGSRVVESTDADAGEIGRFAARQSCDQLLRLLRRKMAI